MQNISNVHDVNATTTLTPRTGLRHPNMNTTTGRTPHRPDTRHTTQATGSPRPQDTGHRPHAQTPHRPTHRPPRSHTGHHRPLGGRLRPGHRPPVPRYRTHHTGPHRPTQDTQKRPDPHRPGHKTQNGRRGHPRRPPCLVFSCHALVACLAISALAALRASACPAAHLAIFR